MGSFKDLEVYKIARVLVKDVYLLTQKELFKKDYSLIDQIRRASISIMSNIAEGHERSGIKDRIHFIDYAKGSCAEVRAQIMIALDLKYVTEEEYLLIDDKCDHVLRMLENYKKYLNSTE